MFDLTPTTTALPKTTAKVLVFSQAESEPVIGFHYNGVWYKQGLKSTDLINIKGEVSHWADLPKMPEVELRVRSLAEVKADYVRQCALGL
ncbi:hypothetical protein [Cysteiniphilum marinum]|uniref:hypothetical protein n=1 Tax=Cysteiniphilum marinum TaxID=2774191 RepID=UPI00193A916B|nr:hypothetical protein [Cysteiniphilum marinum]